MDNFFEKFYIGIIKNKKQILYFLFFLFFLFFLYFYHCYNKNLRYEKASFLYNKIVFSLYKSDFNTAINLSNFVLVNYDDTYYKNFCLMILSNIDYKKNDFNNLIIHLKKIIYDNDNDLKFISYFKLFKILYSNNMVYDAFFLMDSINSNFYFSLFEELKGDIFHYINNNDKAKLSYFLSYNNLKYHYNINSIKLKINNLGILL